MIAAIGQSLSKTNSISWYIISYISKRDTIKYIVKKVWQCYENQGSRTAPELVSIYFDTIYNSTFLVKTVELEIRHEYGKAFH